MSGNRELTWFDVKDLPNDHPAMKRFTKQMDEQMECEDDAWAQLKPGDLSDPFPEGSLAEFDRYIAGDR